MRKTIVRETILGETLDHSGRETIVGERPQWVRPLWVSERADVGHVTCFHYLNLVYEILQLFTFFYKI